MQIDDKFLNNLLAKAAESPRLRTNYDLRTSEKDGSQRMLNALLPGTEVPIHRHPLTSETVVLLKGSVTEIFFDEKGNEVKRFDLGPRLGESDNAFHIFAIQIPKGQWHTIIANAPSVIFESKDGAFTPTAPEDIMTP